MNKRNIIISIALFAVLMLVSQRAVSEETAGLKPGDNLLVNGELEAEQTSMPPFWTISPGEGLHYSPNQGPHGIGCFRLTEYNKLAKTKAVIRQSGIGLVAGERYRISAKIKTKMFHCGHHGVKVINNGWTTEQGIGSFDDNQDWTQLSMEFDAAESSNGSYSFVVFAIDYYGELSVADLKLEPLSKGALEGSKRALNVENITKPRLVPVEPLLHRIPADRPELTFKFFGKLEAGTTVADYDIFWKCDNDSESAQPLKTPLNVVPLSRNRPWRGKLHSGIRNRKSGKVVLQQVHDVETIDVRNLSARNHRRLNNLVTEILNGSLKATADEQRFEFVNVRNGWLYLAVRDSGDSPVEVIVGDKAVINAESIDKETFRELPEGNYSLIVKGAANGGKIIVRQIADIFNYCPGVNNHVPENGKYDWPMMSKYMLRAVTTLNGGSIPNGHLEWVRSNGYHWLANTHATPEVLKDESSLPQILAQCNGLVKPQYDGVTCDELFFFNPGQLCKFTQGLKDFENPEDRLIYTWVVGKPTESAIDLDFISACINASRSRGRIMYEIYCRTKENEEDARTYIVNFAQKTAEAMRQIYPAAMGNLGIIFGNFNQVPILSLQHHPSVDYKYFLDMQLNLVANDPAFEGLGSTGYWGSYYADRELYRWSAMLLRHYCVEGNTDMLSTKYGFTYTPNHIMNGDFNGTLEPWTATGNVTTDSFKNFSATSQNRWGGTGGVGDTFAVFTKEGTEISTLSQKVTGLIPGRMYCLQFSTADADDIKAKRLNPRKFGISANLGDGAKVDDTQSWLHIDMRKNGRYAHNNGVARINLHHIVFKATAPETIMTFSNAESLAGEHLALNFVMLNPFLEE